MVAEAEVGEEFGAQSRVCAEVFFYLNFDFAEQKEGGFLNGENVGGGLALGAEVVGAEV